MTHAKICGLTTPETLDAALAGGAAFVGAVVFPKSPRHIDPLHGATLFERARGRAGIVAVTVDADDALLTEIALILKPDLIQLHGRETVADIRNAKRNYGLPVIRAVGVGTAEDLAGLGEVEVAADHLLLDARPPKGADRTGGHGLAFDWSLLTGRTFSKPWFLAGGLNPDNVVDAVQATGAPMVDVSSGVETAPGVKDAGRIAAFIQAVRRT